jgi:hypothetical protein
MAQRQNDRPLTVSMHRAHKGAQKRFKGLSWQETGRTPADKHQLQRQSDESENADNTRIAYGIWSRRGAR